MKTVFNNSLLVITSEILLLMIVGAAALVEKGPGASAEASSEYILPKINFNSVIDVRVSL